MCHGEIEGNAAAHGQAEDERSRNIKVRHQGLQVVGVRVRLLRRWKCGLAKSTRAVTDPVLLGERLELVIPHPGIQRHPMDEDQGVTGPSHLIIEPCTIYLGKPSLFSHRHSSPFSKRRAISPIVAPTSIPSRERLTLTLTGHGERMRASGPVGRVVGRLSHVTTSRFLASRYPIHPTPAV